MDFLNFLVQFRNPVTESIAQVITYFGQEFIIIGIICWLYWCQNKRLAYTLGFTYFISGLLAQGLKITFRIPRPWILDPNFQAVPSALPAATGYSFPSGHTQSATALYGTLGLACKRTGWKILCFSMLFMVGFSRMFLGCHTPKDVCTAWILTIIITIVVYKVWAKIDQNHSKDLLIGIALAVIVCALWSYAYILYRSNTLTYKYAADCCKACGAGLGFAIGFYCERRYVNFSTDGTLTHRILRIVLGLVGALVLELGLKYLCPQLLILDALRYCLIILWILLFFPMIFQRYEKQKISA
ncbi:MAG: phosphatase PAP2 family protein [Lachnospiraceae bacterium]|nr:phosphatase PAP2 family protein [Lachnospiraceae bacterium]